MSGKDTLQGEEAEANGTGVVLPAWACGKSLVDLQKEFPWLDVRADGMRCTMCCASDAAFHTKFGGNKYWTENQPTNAFKSAKKVSLKRHAQTAVHVAIARENAEAGRRLNAGQKDRPGSRTNDRHIRCRRAWR